MKNSIPIIKRNIIFPRELNNKLKNLIENPWLHCHVRVEKAIAYVNEAYMLARI